MIAPGTIEIVRDERRTTRQTLARVRMTGAHGWINVYRPTLHDHWCVMSVVLDGDSPRGVNLYEHVQAPGGERGLTDEENARLNAALAEHRAARTIADLEGAIRECERRADEDPDGKFTYASQRAQYEQRLAGLRRAA